ncbi:bifunctional diguanylate cyclase/phosphodiesterase [uncultured Pseudokineococcus sp.]|uniref:putative bifunctional diguanylate cyclase/phosphodiesterase n=1 Tax=uncultured Pseudokineococcus sp. TaxID=1642928 RepID=UPI0026158B06|nr:EAL domain-containing protein [uncultured Pseudokineococcus sp.]
MTEPRDRGVEAPAAGAPPRSSAPPRPRADREGGEQPAVPPLVPARPDVEALWHAAPCAHLLVSAEGLVTDVNETFLRWTGHGREDVVGSAFTRLLPVGDRILYSTNGLPQLTLTGRLDEVALQIRGADGTRQAALLSAVRLDGDGSVLVALFSAAGRRRYELGLLTARRRAEASEARTAEAEAQAQHLVRHDPLTGLLNRTGLLEVLDRALRAADREAPAAVLYIDLDGFKTVNDSLGHASGDELLVAAASRLRTALPEDAVLARLAGDEFAVLHGVPVDDVPPLAEGLLAALGAPVLLSGVEVVVSASIGVAVADDAAGARVATREGGPGDGADEAGERLLQRADAAMYRAKAAGRACWRRHETGCADPTADRLLLLEQLRHAITDGQLRLHYQPRVEVGSGAVVGVEALVRWQHPTRGLLPPSEFVDVAEESGLVRELGAWVLEEAVAQAVRWERHPDGAAVQMAVNVSARQLVDPELVPAITELLERHGLPAPRLVLEITETALMREPEVALAALSSLRALGLHLAVDDFGTGYSSFTYLKRFPVDELKIDRSFVAGMTTDPRDHAIVASCVGLGHALGVVVVGEGVETPQQRAALEALGCDLAQGYSFSRPVPPGPVPPTAS